MADRIAVLEDGKITEQGTHEELVAHGGTYAKLYELQARGFRT
jgi:ABC-type multidrug transport system fused ATPase/permease subunit